ncbi:MAG: hypothetical protein ABJB05_09380 [Parafilimonas sp.]
MMLPHASQSRFLKTAKRIIIIIITITTPTQTPAEKIVPIAWHELSSIDKKITAKKGLMIDIDKVFFELHKELQEQLFM